MRIAVTMAAVALVSGCAGSSSPAAHGGGTDTIRVAIKNHKVIPADHREDVQVGDTVQLEVTSDKNDVVHVHGVNIEKPVSAGKTLTITFKVTDAGIYEVETHTSNLTLLQIEAR
jgi:plastocyanin